MKIANGALIEGGLKYALTRQECLVTQQTIIMQGYLKLDTAVKTIFLANLQYYVTLIL